MLVIPASFEAVDDYFTTAQAAEFHQVAYDYVEETEPGHGPLEARRYWLTEDLRTLSKARRWTGLRSIGSAEREYGQAAKRFKEKRFFINSIAADAKLFARAVRSHWGIDNQLHWRAGRWCFGRMPAAFAKVTHR